jgi:hypothetical protein
MSLTNSPIELPLECSEFCQDIQIEKQVDSVSDLQVQLNDLKINDPIHDPISSTTPKIKHKFICKNTECNKGYDKKEFECYDMDFCCKKCLLKIVTLLRDAERKEKDERESKNKYIGNLSYGGSTGGAC